MQHEGCTPTSPPFLPQEYNPCIACMLLRGESNAAGTLQDQGPVANIIYYGYQGNRNGWQRHTARTYGKCNDRSNLVEEDDDNNNKN